MLDSTTTRPNELDVAPDGRVFYIEREGAVKVWLPKSRTTEMVGFIPVKSIQTNGLMGLTLDPDFQQNGWIYLYYAPVGDDTHNTLARYTVSDNRIDPASRQVILRVPTDRYIGGGPHNGGSMIFGPDGNLFLAVGDNTNPEEVGLSTPIDERPGREHFDAQRTAGNTMSLRGKILRIRPLADGGYEIPAGNLFPYGAVGRPEIFVMGNRNPFRITVDPQTGWLYWGDYGPSASGSEKRGAVGYDEFNQAKDAGFYGWPYFNGNNHAFRNYDFAADTSGRYFDPKGPINDSPNNTGARLLPPARPAMIWYPSGPSEKFPEMGVGGRGPMGGAVYRYDDDTVGRYGLPEYYHGQLFIMEFMRRWIKTVSFNENGDLADIKPFLPEMTFLRPFDMDIGPDGSIYLIEWGDNYQGWFNDRGKIVRLKYHGTDKRPPAAVLDADRTSGSVPLTVEFTAAASRTRSGVGTPLTYAWDFNGDGQTDATGVRPTYTYEKPGRYSAQLTVRDGNGMRSRKTVTITAGNTAPEVIVDWPLNGGIVDLDESVGYQVSVTDPEDGTVPTSDIEIEPQLAHDSHWHDLETWSSEESTFEISSHARDFFLEDLYGRLEVSYTDDGGQHTRPLSTEKVIILQPRRKDAAHVTNIYGAQRGTTEDVRWQENVDTYLDVDDGNYVSYAPVNLRNINSITLRVAPESGGTITARLDSLEGERLGSVTVDAIPANADREKLLWREVEMPVTDPGGAHEIYFTFSGPSDKKRKLMRVDWLEFNGPGMMRRP